VRLPVPATRAPAAPAGTRHPVSPLRRRLSAAARRRVPAYVSPRVAEVAGTVPHRAAAPARLPLRHAGARGSARYHTHTHTHPFDGPSSETTRGKPVPVEN